MFANQPAVDGLASLAPTASPSARSVLSPQSSVLLLWACLTSAAALAQPTATVIVPPVSVTTRVDPQRVTIGTPFRYTMRVETTGDAEVLVPILAERLGEFVIQDFGAVPATKSETGGTVVERWYTLVTYEAGDQLIPGAPVQYREPGTDLQRAETPETLVIVDSLLPKNEEALAKATLHDIKGPVAVPRDYRPLGYAAAGLAAVIGLGFGLYRLLNRSRRIVQPPARPAHEIALEALVRLRGARLLEEGRHEEFYVQLSAIVRTYLEQRFTLRAPEMTTEEFLQAAQRNRQLPVEHRGSLTQFLNEADLVKFARYVPALEDAERAYKAGRQFIESTAISLETNRAAA
jgi:hypothetical protein